MIDYLTSPMHLWCPRCGSTEVDNFSGEYYTGVAAPDGYCERVTGEFSECEQCGHVWCMPAARTWFDPAVMAADLEKLKQERNLNENQ